MFFSMCSSHNSSLIASAILSSGAAPHNYRDTNGSLGGPGEEIQADGLVRLGHLFFSASFCNHDDTEELFHFQLFSCQFINKM